ncbi:hypothetical protein SAMN05518871_10283 [Psychrobacillus sp. OK028]|uniref:hypothetical protein n=1 Tax=Psychrobacillus sp. OK028 TaxID=1884359 RepID=UPI0008888AD7|nr:hypothetical protein [Psychrobacillus sp. OK028]SDM72063.1 hypothetical protein SAMN05518871_10283 [Psychrobacillus sp. OK028]
MNKNNLNFRQDNPDQQTESQAAKLAVIATAITTFGDALATIAAVLALEESRQNNSDSSDNKNLQKQIDHLNDEIKYLKKQINSQKRFY